MKHPRYLLPLIGAAVGYVLLNLQWAHSVVWDEIEFYRATKWIAEGRMPFRDFWEHHLPLQWFLFAPFAALIDSPGTAAIVLMRWAQLVLWVLTLAVLFRLMRDAGIERSHAWIAVCALLASPLFVESAVEYRVDIPGDAAFLLAVALVFRRPQSPRAWLAFGALMSAAVLSNLRLVYLVVVTAGLFAFADVRERRWRWNPRALWMAPGALAVAAAFCGWLVAAGAVDEFREAMRLNVVADRVMAESAGTFFPILMKPFTMIDVAAMALYLAGFACALLALRELRKPGILQLIALLAILSVLALARLGVHYPYHLQTTLLLLVPLAAAMVRPGLIRNLTVAGIAVVLVVQLARFTRSNTHVPMQYHDAVMREVDRRTLPAEKVWDGVGAALRREPAYRYWFLPSVVRIAAQRNLIPPYRSHELMQDPPAAILHSVRVRFWFLQFPDAGLYVAHHYVPLYRDLWIPGLSGTLEKGQRANWRAPRAGRYRLVASELLPKHPWFFTPFDYAITAGTDATTYEVDLKRLPQVDRRQLQLVVDGVPVDAPVFTLKKHAHVSLQSNVPNTIGVLIVPDDVTTLFISPEGPVLM
ncbi:MAG TPA: glycosyltransferase family 39 protein [Thermoanaerobaculia bacterium]|nr:glycosyltransferase family 39 protein [Thermoanaerobaculia bacterium]